MKKKIIFASILVILVVIALVSFRLTGRVVDDSRQEVKIGAILMLTGEYAVIGEGMQKGIDIAVEEVNKNLKDKKIKVIYEDSGLVDKKKITNAAIKLINIDKVDAVIIDTISTLKPVAPLFQENKIPVIVLWDNTKFIESQGDYIFSIGFSTEKTGERMAEFVYNSLGLRKIAVISHIDEWAEIITDSFKKKFEELGGEIVVSDKIQVGHSDFRTQITKIKNSEAEGIYLAFLPVNLDLFLKQLKEQNVNLPRFGGDTFTDDVINAVKDVAEGVYFTNIYLEDNPRLDNFVNKYRITYNKEPESLPSNTFGYDGVMLLKEALDKIEEINPENLKDALYQIRDFELISGDTISIIHGNITLRVEKIYQIVNGKSIEVKI